MKKLFASTTLAVALAASVPSGPAQAQAVPLMGSVQVFAGNFCPRGWVPADGRVLPISQYTAMFSLYGTIYGGDGRSTFAMPNLNGRVAIGHGTGPGLPSYPIGARSGVENITMTLNEMPNHTHTYQVFGSTTTANFASPQGTLVGTSSGNPNAFVRGGSDDTAMAPNMVTSAENGGSISFNNMQPFLAQFFCVAIEGTYPSRS